LHLLIVRTGESKKDSIENIEDKKIETLPIQSVISGVEHHEQASSQPIRKFNPVRTVLLIETIAIPVLVIAIIKILVKSGIADTNWLIIPVILITAGTVPTLFRRRILKHTGLNLNNFGLSLRLLFWVSVLILPSAFFTLWLISSFGLNLPLQPAAPPQGRWIHWIIFQFLYVAFAEEVFFRGFVQGNLLILSRNLVKVQYRFQRYGAIILSALCFAIAHIVILSSFSGFLTFLPGLIFGWLFLRTRSLFAPVLFHGIANTCYCLFMVFLI
jgi:membrane protease YdiL (CAAX protease family)